MMMLAAYLHEQERQEAWQAYTAQMLWYLNNATHQMFGKKFEHPTWLEMSETKSKDSRSGAEIVEDVKQMLIRRKKKREGGK